MGVLGAMSAISRAHAALAVGFAGVTAACAGTVEVTRTYPPADAARIDETRFRPTAVIRDGARVALPEGARAAHDRVVLPGEPGTIALEPSDGVEMRGEVGPGDDVPGGGRAVSKRATGALVDGAVLFAMGWLPAVYVGFQSPRAEDRVLVAPVVGPWIDWAGRGKCVSPPNRPLLSVDPCVAETAIGVALVASGGVQLVGAVLVAVGLPARVELVGGDRGVAIVPAPGGIAAAGTF